MPSKTLRKDAKKNLSKVAGAVAKDPLATEREIAKKTGLGNATAHRTLKKMEQSGAIERNSDTIRIAKTDLEHLEQIQSIEGSHISEYAEKANRGEFLNASELEAVNRIGERKQKRASFFLGENANKDGGEKENPFKQLLSELNEE